MSDDEKLDVIMEMIKEMHSEVISEFKSINNKLDEITDKIDYIGERLAKVEQDIVVNTRIIRE